MWSALLNLTFCTPKMLMFCVMCIFFAIFEVAGTLKQESCLSYLKLKIRSVSTNQFSNFKVVCVSSLVGDGISYSRYTLPANATETDVHKRRCAVWSIQTFRTMLDLANRMAWSHVIIFTDNDTDDSLAWGQVSQVQQLVLNIDVTEAANFSNIVLQQHRRSLQNKVHLCVIVMCSRRGQLLVLQLVSTLKLTLHRLSAFDMRSLWLVAAAKTDTDVAVTWTSTVQNVAIVVSSSHTTTRRSRARPLQQDVENNVSKEMCNGLKSKTDEAVPNSPSDLTRTLFPLTQYGMNNKTLDVATLPFHTFVIRHKQKGITTYSGLSISILDILARSLNFSYTIQEPKDGQWGKDIGNGTYSGMVGEIIREEIDLIAAPIIPQVERIHKIDFTIPYAWDRIVVIFKKPPLTSLKWMTLVNPFQWEVYVCIGASLVFVVCLIVFVEWNNPYYSPEARQRCTIWHIVRHFTWYAYGSLIKHGGLHLPDSMSGRFLNGFWLLFCTIISAIILCFPGGLHLPDSMSGRFLIGFWLLFCTIISAVYSANLIAFLTVNIENLRFHTVEDLLDEESFEWGSTGNYPFRTLKNGEDRRLWDRIEEKRVNTNFAKLTDQLAKIRNGSYVFVNHNDILSVWASADCDLRVIVPKLSVSVTYTFGLPFNSDFTHIISDKILRIIDSGMLDAIIASLADESNSKTCNQKTSTGARTVDLEDLQSAFYLLGAGLAVSLLAVCAEMIHTAVVARNAQTAKSKYKPKKLSRFF